MTTHQLVSTEKITKLILVCSQKRFTGRLDLDFDVEALKFLRSWSLEFHQGSLTGCTTSVHPQRFWCRHVSLQCPELPTYNIGQSIPGKFWDYNALTVLVRQGKIQQEQMAAIVAGQIKEILFDIQQYSEQLVRHYHTQKQLIYKLTPEDTTDAVNSPLVLLPGQHLWQQAMHNWETWVKAGLAEYSPNLSPVVLQTEELRQRTSAAAYSNFVSMADGNWSLRDLAHKLKQKLLPLTQSVVHYIHIGAIKLIEIEDFKKEERRQGVREKVTTPHPPTPIAPAPLVACIDDNQNDSLKMSNILTQASYRFINIQDPVKALLILLEQKPDLIFLDLVMPIANGYEICSQIRRISAFKDTPIVILTSNDGIVDRVRARMVGATDFLAKPIEREKVLRFADKYLAKTTIGAHIQKIRTMSKNQNLPQVEPEKSL
ncbi:MAG: response regulator [Rhizonema sp. PD37]|nr:response regulator [Rhizonema sp. PD37]